MSKARSIIVTVFFSRKYRHRASRELNTMNQEKVKELRQESNYSRTIEFKLRKEG